MPVVYNADPYSQDSQYHAYGDLMTYSRWFEMHSMDISIDSTEGLWRCIARVRPSRDNRVITIFNAPDPFNSGWRKTLEEAVYYCYEKASKYQFLDKIRK